MSTHLSQRHINDSRSESGTGKGTTSISLGLLLAIAGLVLALVSCFDDCFGHEAKVLILIITAGVLVTLAAVYALYRFEVHTHPHVVNPLIGFLVGLVVVLLFEVGGCGH